MVCHTSLYGTASVQSGNDRAAAADASNATNPATATEVAAGAPRTSLFGGDRVAARLGQAANSTSKTDDTTMADNADAKSSAVQTGGIHYYCSAAHLKVASKTFEKALSGEWVESMRKDDGRYHIVVEDWDEEALLILLNVLHAKYDEVPRTVDLELLAKLVTVIDYYQCREATALITEKWLGDALAKSGPSNFFARPLILWLYVAVVFRHSGIFELATKHIVELGVDGSLRNLGLPIPQVVSGMLEPHK